MDFIHTKSKNLYWDTSKMPTKLKTLSKQDILTKTVEELISTKVKLPEMKIAKDLASCFVDTNSEYILRVVDYRDSANRFMSFSDREKNEKFIPWCEKNNIKLCHGVMVDIAQFYMLIGITYWALYSINELAKVGTIDSHGLSDLIKEVHDIAKDHEFDMDKLIKKLSKEYPLTT